MYKRSKQLEVIGYLDLDFTGCHVSKNSTFGYLFFWQIEQFYGKMLKNLSLPHPLLKLNLWHVLKPQLKVYGSDTLFHDGVFNTIAKLLKIYCDNFSAVFFTKNDIYSKGVKHTELKYLVKEV